MDKVPILPGSVLLSSLEDVFIKVKPKLFLVYVKTGVMRGWAAMVKPREDIWESRKGKGKLKIFSFSTLLAHELVPQFPSWQSLLIVQGQIKIIPSFFIFPWLFWIELVFPSSGLSQHRWHTSAKYTMLMTYLHVSISTRLWPALNSCFWFIL